MEIPLQTLPKKDQYQVIRGRQSEFTDGIQRKCFPLLSSNLYFNGHNKAMTPGNYVQARLNLRVTE